MNLLHKVVRQFGHGLGLARQPGKCRFQHAPVTQRQVPAAVMPQPVPHPRQLIQQPCQLAADAIARRTRTRVPAADFACLGLP